MRIRIWVGVGYAYGRESYTHIDMNMHMHMYMYMYVYTHMDLGMNAYAYTDLDMGMNAYAYTDLNMHISYYIYNLCKTGKKKARRSTSGQKKNRRRPTFPGSFPPSIIGSDGLNYCVRDGNRCNPNDIVTGFSLLNVLCTFKTKQCSLENLVKCSTY